MGVLEAVVLALVQGITEFLPVSSSAHLILLPRLLGWEDQGLAFDVMVHVGTLAAIVWHFRADVWAIVRCWFGQFANQAMSEGAREYARLGNFLIVATIPAGLVGLLLGNYVDIYLRSPLMIAGITLVFGVLLGLADCFSGRRTLTQMSFMQALWFGLAQALALIPGVSRSGVTLTMGLALGFSRESAARFSFLMSIPIIVLAGGLKAVELMRGEVALDPLMAGISFMVSAGSAYVCVRVFLALLARVGMLPYVVYRVLLAMVLWLVFR